MVTVAHLSWRQPDHTDQTLLIAKDGSGDRTFCDVFWDDEGRTITAAQAANAQFPWECVSVTAEHSRLDVSVIFCERAGLIFSEGTRGPGDYEHACKSRSTSVQKCDNLMKGCTLEVTVEYRGADDGR